jgi:hypothetical protein
MTSNNNWKKSRTDGTQFLSARIIPVGERISKTGSHYQIIPVSASYFSPNSNQTYYFKTLYKTYWRNIIGSSSTKETGHIFLTSCYNDSPRLSRGVPYTYDRPLLPREVHSTQYTVHSTQYTVHSTQYTHITPHPPTDESASPVCRFRF